MPSNDDDRVDAPKAATSDKFELIDLERTRHLRVAASLNGYGTYTLEETYAGLVAELRSSNPLSRELRDAIADALECGQIGDDGVRMKIEAPGRHFRTINTAAAEYRLIEAGRYICIEEKKNRTFSAIYSDLASTYEVADAQDYGRRARKLFAEFIEYCKRNMDDIALWSASMNVQTTPGQNSRVEYDEGLILHDDDVFYYARSAFIESRHPSND